MPPAPQPLEEGSASWRCASTCNISERLRGALRRSADGRVQPRGFCMMAAPARGPEDCLDEKDIYYWTAWMRKTY